MTTRSSNNNTVCRYCKEKINSSATICHHCGKHQKKLWNYIDTSPKLITIIMVFISSIQVFLVFQQLQEARRKRIEASDVLSNSEKIEKNMTKRQQTLESEVRKLEQRNAIYTLGDSAIAYHDRKAFNKLIQIAKDTKSNLSLIATSQLNRVYSFHGSLQYTGELSDTLSNGAIKNEKTYTEQELIDILTNDRKWQRRAASARLLSRFHKADSLNAVKTLFYAIKDDDNLCVVRLAMVSFSSYTGFESKDVFGFEDYYKFWNDNSQKFLK